MDNEENINNIPCPEFVFECDGCIVGNQCPNPIKKVKMDAFDTCDFCNDRIEIGTSALIRNNIMYHYTDGKNNKYEKCIDACKESYEKEVENE